MKALQWFNAPRRVQYLGGTPSPPSYEMVSNGFVMHTAGYKSGMIHCPYLED